LPFDQLRSTLFASALLSTIQGLDHRSRSRIASQINSFDVYSQRNVTDEIKRTALAVGIDLSSWECPASRVLYNTVRTADQWMEQGIVALSVQDLRAPLAQIHDIGPLMFAWGNLKILDRPAAAILNSRKPRLPNPDDRWLLATKRVVRAAIDRGFAIVSGYGLLPYCIVSLLAKGSPTLVACDEVLPFMQSPQQLQRFLAQYGELFDLDKTLFFSPFPPGRMPQRAVRYAERDHLVGALSSMILAVEIKERGNMQSVLQVAIERGLPVEYANDQCPGVEDTTAGNINLTSRTGEALKTGPADNGATFSRSQLESNISGKSDVYRQLCREPSYLIHYTRSCPGPWPGQSWAEYCRSLVEGVSEASHSAFDTLVRILRERRIRGSRRLIRGAESVVCLTECVPRELQDLIEWRKGLVRWNFEPYGLAFGRKSLFDLGAKPVIYAVEEAFADLSPDLKHLFQCQNHSDKQWTFEKEWRIKGDLCLADFDPRDLVVIVVTHAEAAVIQEQFGYKVALAGIQMRKSGRSRQKVL